MNRFIQELNGLPEKSAQLFFLCLLQFSSPIQTAAADPAAQPAPTYAPRPDEGKGELPGASGDPLFSIVLEECKKGTVKACSNAICLPDWYTQEKISEACSHYEAVARQFSYRCEVSGNGYEFKSRYIGMVRSKSDCDEITKAWNGFSSDPRIRGRYQGDQALEIFNQLLLPPKNKRKSDPGVLEDLKFRKRNASFKLRNEDLEDRVWSNFEDWKEENWCGPGIVPGAEKLPVLNQRRQGTCYANSAATLINFQLQKEGFPPDYGISPTHIASRYFKSNTIVNTDSPFSSGSVCKSIKKTDRLCEMDRVEGAIYRRMTAASGLPRVKQHLQNRQKLYQATVPIARSPNQKRALEWAVEDLDPLKSENDQTNLFLDVVGGFFETGDFESIARSIREVASGQSCQSPVKVGSIDPLVLELAALPERDLASFYSFLTGQLCEGSPLLPKQITKSNCQSDEYSPDVLESQLRRGSIVESCINSEFLYSADAEKGACDHSVVVLGTARDSKGTCGYVVRNSWGKDCSWADPEYDCKDGTVVIPKEVFKKAAKYLEWL